MRNLLAAGGSVVLPQADAFTTNTFGCVIPGHDRAERTSVDDHIFRLCREPTARHVHQERGPVTPCDDKGASFIFELNAWQAPDLRQLVSRSVAPSDGTRRLHPESRTNT